MPSITITTSQITQLLNSPEKQTTITTPLGNAILEIQGDLEIPNLEPEAQYNDTEQRINSYNEIPIFRFGLLSISDDMKNATLFVGNKQRLLGSVIALETPLGLLKFDETDGSVEMCDIMHFKILFKDRPLPIM